MQKITVQIRHMIKRDLDEVLLIEEQAFQFAWTREEFCFCLARKTCLGIVAEYQEKIVGFSVYEFQEDCLQVLNFAVTAHLRRMSIGEQLVKTLICKMLSQNRNSIYLAVRETNLAAQLFFRQMGFEAEGILVGEYEDTDEDAYVMRYALDSYKPQWVNRIAGYLEQDCFDDENK